MNTTEIAALALQADLQRLSSVSQNLANVQTAGYKRQVQVQRPFSLQWEAAVRPASIALDARSGALRTTHDAMDIAVDGDGFFAVQAADGRALVRQLSLHTDAAGLLVHSNGQPVLGERGEIRVPEGATDLHVDAGGDVVAGGRPVGRLQVWQVRGNALQPLGNGLYQAPADQWQPKDGAKLAVGYQEASNVDSSAEMVRLMETTRHFEAMARTLQGMDDSMEKAIRKLGEL